MLARPFASETVATRAVCRLKCSVVANVTAGPRRSPNRRASRAWSDAPDAVDSVEPLVGRMESEHATASEDRLGPHRPQEEETIEPYRSRPTARAGGRSRRRLGARKAQVTPGSPVGSKSRQRPDKSAAADRSARLIMWLRWRSRGELVSSHDADRIMASARRNACVARLSASGWVSTALRKAASPASRATKRIPGQRTAR